MSMTTGRRLAPATKRANTAQVATSAVGGRIAAAEAAASATVGGGIGCGGVLRRAAWVCGPTPR